LIGGVTTELAPFASAPLGRRAPAAFLASRRLSSKPRYRKTRLRVKGLRRFPSIRFARPQVPVCLSLPTPFFLRALFLAGPFSCWPFYLWHAVPLGSVLLH